MKMVRRDVTVLLRQYIYMIIPVQKSTTEGAVSKCRWAKWKAIGCPREVMATYNKCVSSKNEK